MSRSGEIHESAVTAGTDLFVLQRRLGHESITTTTETYAHLLPDQQRAAADAASRSLSGLVPGQAGRTRELNVR